MSVEKFNNDPINLESGNNGTDCSNCPYLIERLTAAESDRIRFSIRQITDYCDDYFQRSGKCIIKSMSELSGLNPDEAFND